VAACNNYNHVQEHNTVIQQIQRPPLELWGGIEGTVNRVGDRYFDQMVRNGHDCRQDDLDRIAGLGITALRYPVLWERVAPNGLPSADWSWPDARLARLRALGVRPIVGLVHHGSGPAHTSLIDPAFPEGLAAYAGAVAARYPWVEDYTPVNEPLTTARFSALYGHWYPHTRDDCSFARALLIQCKATVLAMEAIRVVNPHAHLIQTEDMGKSYGTPHMAYQADFENQRRWLSFDLLCGRVLERHPLWGYLRDCDIPEDEILWFQDHPCPPDVVGINSYLTSERWLDERVERFPTRDVGGNGRDTYADVAAIHMLPDGIAGQRVLLREAWERYGLPVAVTEAHLGCSREEQMRWLVEVWEAAQANRAEGVDVRAVTVWSLLGAFDWNSLVTREAGFYEPGAFDVRGPTPRLTALGAVAAELAAGQEPSHPVINGPGWWRRHERFIFGAPDMAASIEMPLRADSPVPPLLILGAGGALGSTFARLCAIRGLEAVALSRAELDIADRAAVEAYIAALRPWAVVNAAGYVRVDEAERDRASCLAVNSMGAANLAAACARHGIRLLTFSSGLVFDGAKGAPYVEEDLVAPLGVYGQSKAAAERQVLELLPAALVVRASACFGPWDDDNFVARTLRALARGERPLAVEDEVITPTYMPDLVHTSLDLLIDGERGIWHLANQGAVTWAELGRLAAVRARLDPEGVTPISGRSLQRPARRPAYRALGSARGLLLPPLEEAIGNFLVDSAWQPVAPPHAEALGRE
jgi:dTDP-4-dehydrorhamnose reductase